MVAKKKIADEMSEMFKAMLGSKAGARSLAAFKANETRRKEAAKRSKAAKKAWQSRRAA